jgi:N-acetylmuramoyl-L-alanine amidase
MGDWHLGSRGITVLLPSTGFLALLLLMAALVWPAMVLAGSNASRGMAGKTLSSPQAARSRPPMPAAPRLALVRDIRYWNNPPYTRVVIDVEGAMQYRVGRLYYPDRLYLDLMGTQLAPQLPGRAFASPDDGLNGLRAAQNQPDVVRVVLDLKPLDDYHVFTMSDPSRLVIDIKGAQAQSSPPPPPAAPDSTPKQTSITAMEPKRIGSAQEHRWQVVIDPGHGGKDSGAIGPSGVMEKDIVLDIAQRLRALMQREPLWRVTMTRDTDVFIPLEERTAVANAKSADVFVSIHVNAAERAELYGTETYFLALATDEGAMRTAARENATTLKQVSDLELILRDLVLTSKRNESSLLAGSVQRALVQAPTGGKNGRDLGVKHAPFLVLMGAEMPAILVEVAFLSNPAEERRLSEPKSREQAAQAILAGLKEFIAAAPGSTARQVSR